MRMHRQRESRIRQCLAGREIAAAVTEVSQRGLKMKRDRIMDSALDLLLQQRVANGVAPGAPNDEQVVTGFGSFGFEHRLSVQWREQLAIGGGDYASALVPFRELFQFRAQDRGLDRIEPGVVAANLMRVVRQAAVIAEARYAMRNLVVIGRDRAAIAPCAEIFTGIKAEASSVAERSRHFHPVSRADASAMGLARILDQFEVELGRNFFQLDDRRGQAI